MSPSFRQSWNQSRQVMRLPVQLWKYFVRDDPFDALVVEVGGGRGIGQQQRRIEDVEALVLHRAGVEVAHRDDHEQVEVILAAKASSSQRMARLRLSMA